MKGEDKDCSSTHGDRRIKGDIRRTKDGEWPERPDLSSHVLEDDDEVKKAPAVCLTIIDEGVATVNKLIDHY